MKYLLPFAATLAVALSIPFHACAQESKEVTAVAKPVSDLTQFKTPAALLAYIQGIDQRPADTNTEFDANARAVRLATADFLKRFPKDHLAWEVKLIDARLVVDATGRGEKDDSLAKAEATLQAIAAANDADAKTRYAANVALARVQLRTVPDNGIEPWIVAWHKAHPDGWRDETLGELMADRLRNLDAAKAEAILTTLKNSKDNDVYGSGEDLLWAAIRKRREAEMKVKPLDLKFTALDGTAVDVSKLRGKVVIVDFWATWCHPCMEQVPSVVAAYNKFHDKGLEVIGISLDENKENVLTVTKAKGMVWPQYFDGEGWNNKISYSYGINSIPRMWLLNKKGMVVDLEAHDHLDEKIAKLLAVPE